MCGWARMGGCGPEGTAPVPSSGQWCGHGRGATSSETSSKCRKAEGPPCAPSPRPWDVWPLGRRSAQGEAGKVVQMMGCNEKRVTMQKRQGQRGVRREA